MHADIAISSAKSEEKYAKLFQLSSNLLSLSTFKEGRFLEVNDAFLTTLGYSREEVIGKTALELGLYANPADREQLLKPISGNEQIRNLELRISAKDGALHDALFSASKISVNNESCWLVSITDITALKQAEHGLLACSARYQHIVEDQAELICRYQADGKLSFVNEAYARYFGKSCAELVGHNFIPHIPGPDLALIAPRLAGISRDNPLATCEHRVIMPNGEVRWQQWSHRGIYTYGGRLLEYQAVGRDITDSKRAEQALIEDAENKFKTIFDNASDGVLVADMETLTLHMANASACRMLGYNLEEITRLDIRDIHPAKDYPYVLEQFEKQAKGLTTMAKDMPVKRKDGSVFYADINAAIIAIADKRYLAGFFRDITGRKRAEAELLNAHNQLRNLIAAASQVSIIATDCSGKILTFNRGSELMLGYSATEMIGKQTPAIIHLASEMTARGQELTRELGYPVEGFGIFVAKAKLGQYDEREWTYVKKNGERIIVNLIVTAVKNELDQIVGFLGIAIDITDRKLALQAQASSAAKSQFVAHISHEIRNPLNGIIGTCELLLETKMSDKQLEYAHLINASADTLLNIINSTLDLSKIEAGKLELAQQDFNLRELVENVTTVLAVNAANKQLELINSIELDVPLDLHGDPGRLRQILFNLIGNAVKFTQAGEIVVKVELVPDGECSEFRVQSSGGRKEDPETVARQPEPRTLNPSVLLRFSVRDTGIGIPADKIHLLFKPFCQLDPSLARKFGGTGLGLIITKGLVEQMGGSLGVESKLGQGSTFWISLPFLKQQPEITPTGDAAINFEGARVLIVDDSGTNRDVLAKRLKAWGLETDTAQDGKEALAKLHSAANHKKAFAAAIIDQRMPELDGVTLGQMIKADCALKHTSLFLASPIRLVPEISTQKKRLFAALIRKPMRQKDLFDNLLRTLKGKTARIREEEKAVQFRTHKHPQLGKRLRILVAEDNLANQTVALSILKNMGHRADAVANGREAVQALEKNPYDLVLMDLQMPDMDGLEAATLIRDPNSSVRNHAIPILALTAHALGGYREQCLAVGMNDCITKPVSIHALADAIARVVSPGNAPAPQDKVEPTRLRPSGYAEAPCPAVEFEKHLSFPSNEPAAVFDAKGFAERLSGKSVLMRKIIKLTLQETPKLMRELEQAVKKREQDTAGRLAHNIRGGAGNVGGNRLCAVAAQIETAGKTGDWQKVEQLLPELKRQFAALEKEMRTCAKTLG